MLTGLNLKTGNSTHKSSYSMNARQQISSSCILKTYHAMNDTTPIFAKMQKCIQLHLLCVYPWSKICIIDVILNQMFFENKIVLVDIRNVDIHYRHEENRNFSKYKNTNSVLHNP